MCVCVIEVNWQIRAHGEEAQPERDVVGMAQFAAAHGEGEHGRGRDGQDEGITWVV
jgi:hypothetical protein